MLFKLPIVALVLTSSISFKSVMAEVDSPASPDVFNNLPSPWAIIWSWFMSSLFRPASSQFSCSKVSSILRRASLSAPSGPAEDAAAAAAATAAAAETDRGSPPPAPPPRAAELEEAAPAAPGPSPAAMALGPSGAGRAAMPSPAGITMPNSSILATNSTWARRPLASPIFSVFSSKLVSSLACLSSTFLKFICMELSCRIFLWESCSFCLSALEICPSSFATSTDVLRTNLLTVVISLLILFRASDMSFARCFSSLFFVRSSCFIDLSSSVTLSNRTVEFNRFIRTGLGVLCLTAPPSAAAAAPTLSMATFGGIL
mmetsp:Transcript_12233/g.28515  ORF Transcript_12233/g.28515 Transcript_12233/m.28515 type:complete len:316 (-) Transcript_12233:102-1049(-)